MSKVFDGIMAALREALAIAEGRAEPARQYGLPAAEGDTYGGRRTGERQSDGPSAPGRWATATPP